MRDSAVKQKITLQPFLIGLGKDLFNIQQYLMYNDGIFLKFDSIVAAIDSCFKSFFVFDISYPKQCQNFWIFIQRVIFEIVLDFDEITPSFLRVLVDFSRI